LKTYESSCSCCGVPKRIYNDTGHDRECIWYENEMYRLANEWLNSDEHDVSWKRRYDLVVNFLLQQNKYLQKEEQENV
jgi:hypothetical protein